LSTATDAERLSLRDWLAVFKSSGKEFLSDDCMGLSQQVAYSSLLAFFPAMIFLIAFLDLIGAYGALLAFLDPVAPQSVLNIVHQLERDSGSASVVLLALGIFGALWAGSGAMSSVVKAVNRAYDEDETRPIWKVRLISLVLVLASATVLAGIMLLIIFGGKLGNAIATKANLGSAFTWFWNIARWPIAFTVVLLLFALYTSFSSSYSRTYGSLAAGIVLLLWLNYSAWAVLFGAELNNELDRRRGAT